MKLIDLLKTKYGFYLILSMVLGLAVAFYVIDSVTQKDIKQEISRQKENQPRIQDKYKTLQILESLISVEDTSTTRGKENLKTYYNSIRNLKKHIEIEENIDSRDSISAKNDIFPPLVAASLLILFSMIAFQFVSSFTTIDKNKYKVHFNVDDSNLPNSSSHETLDWLIENEIMENFDIEKAKLWKKIYDLGSKLGDEKNELILSVQNLLGTELAEENSEIIQRNDLFNVFEDTQIRLKQECTRLNKQALLNLGIGFFLAISLLLFNAYVALNPYFGSLSELKLDTFIFLYLPKMLAVISILTMFLYFVRLYKTNVIDVKYYQNEITNVEIKLASLRLALISNNNDVLNILVKDLSNIERNSLLNKDQTSMEIERLRLENEMTKDYLSKTFDFFGGFKENFRVSENK